MSGFVPRRVSSTRTAMGSTDANSTGMNGHSIVSTLGRRSTLLNTINTRAFGSLFQINYKNAIDTGDKCTAEDMAPVKSSAPLQLASNVSIPMTLFRDNFTTGFVTRTMQNALVNLYGGGVFTDKFCSFGDILNNTGDDIFLPNDITGSQSSGASPCRGWRLVAFERWYSGGAVDGSESIAQLSTLGGWEVLQASPIDTQDWYIAQGIVLVLEPVGAFTGFLSEQAAPAIKIGEDTTKYIPTGTAQITEFGKAGNGVPFTGYVIAYGGAGQPGGSQTPNAFAGDNLFIAGTSPGKGKKFSITFVK